jgi:hypothetical protein
MALFEKLLRVIQAYNKKALDIIRGILIKNNKVATAKTISTLRAETEFRIDEYAEINVFGSKVFEYIEQGRPPNSKMPPQGSLLEWMSARGITGSEFAIRKSIAKKGIPPTPIIEMSIIEIKADISNILSSDLIKEMTNTINQSVQKGFKFP